MPDFKRIRLAVSLALPELACGAFRCNKDVGSVEVPFAAGFEPNFRRLLLEIDTGARIKKNAGMRLLLRLAMSLSITSIAQARYEVSTTAARAR